MPKLFHRHRNVLQLSNSGLLLRWIWGSRLQLGRARSRRDESEKSRTGICFHFIAGSDLRVRWLQGRSGFHSGRQELAMGLWDMGNHHAELCIAHLFDAGLQHARSEEAGCSRREEEDVESQLGDGPVGYY